MLVRDYCDFVVRSDWTRKHDTAGRRSIAQYGIASETGSLVSAVKKKLLSPDSTRWNEPTEEILEELGDVIWYTSMLATLDENKRLTDILKSDLISLPKDIDKEPKFKANLKPGNFDKFVSRSQDFIDHYDERQFNDYQKVAFLTARTEGVELLHVCLTRLMFYSTVILSKGFPQFEKLIQRDILDLPLERALGMMMWHVAAIATLYKQPLDEIVEGNVEKLNQLFNLDDEPHTPLHDALRVVPHSQRLPRVFDVSFVSVGEGRLQMYFEGSRLGDELTDNYWEDDGYRFHDIMHLANAAKLGWSPVLRSLMGRKRKYSPKVDSSEDGARAKIVEEAVVKAVHSEAVRIAGHIGQAEAGQTRLFTSKEQIPFNFLKLIKSFVKGLEVEKNHFWEWQEAIVSGHRIYEKLRAEEQGTVHVDLNKRSISFDPRVAPALKGAVVGTGLGQGSLDSIQAKRLTKAEREAVQGDPHRIARLIAQKEAILRAVGLSPDSDQLFSAVSVADFKGGLSVKARGEVRKAVWTRGAISFQSVDIALETGVLCYAIALGDIPT